LVVWIRTLMFTWQRHVVDDLDHSAAKVLAEAFSHRFCRRGEVDVVREQIIPVETVRAQNRR